MRPQTYAKNAALNEILELVRRDNSMTANRKGRYVRALIESDAALEDLAAIRDVLGTPDAPATAPLVSGMKKVIDRLLRLTRSAKPEELEERFREAIRPPAPTPTTPLRPPAAAPSVIPRTAKRGRAAAGA